MPVVEGPALLNAQWSVLSAFIQSAALYTIVLILLLGTFLACVNPEMFCVDALTPIIVRIPINPHPATDPQHL